MKIYVVNNYDSFVYNIIHLLKELEVSQIKIEKNDLIDLEEMATYDKIVLSPGPGIPAQAGKMMEAIHRFQDSHSILGVCLGHQAIGEYFGWQMQQLEEPLHGINSPLQISNREHLFKKIPNDNSVAHYHSWVVTPNEKSDLEILASDIKGNVMAIKHKRNNVFGVQFHPESVLTQNGKTIIQNWLNHSS